MNLIRKITFPFVTAYYAITSLRNTLYDLGLKKYTSYDFPVICVGNLSVGGTGKTPMIEHLIDLLKDDYKVATLSRGYKRKTKDFQLANEFSTAESLGDEPFHFYNKFKNDILVAVDANRVNGINKLTGLENPPQVVLLDDAFQHRKVKAGFNILLTTYSNPYFSDFVLPTGNLREPRSGAKRADIIIVTKCPEHLTDEEKKGFIEQISPKENQHVFFSSISYSSEVIPEENKKSMDSLTNFTLVTGIANAHPLVNFLKKKHFLKNQIFYQYSHQSFFLTHHYHCRHIFVFLVLIHQTAL